MWKLAEWVTLPTDGRSSLCSIVELAWRGYERKGEAGASKLGGRLDKLWHDCLSLSSSLHATRMHRHWWSEAAKHCSQRTSAQRFSSSTTGGHPSSLRRGGYGVSLLKAARPRVGSCFTRDPLCLIAQFNPRVRTA